MKLNQGKRSAACWLVGAMALAACGPEIVGSRYVKSQVVRAGEGALLTVSAGESPELAGTRLEIPAGALANDTTLTVELGLTSLLGAELAAGPAAVFGPAGTTFASDVTLVLPVNALGATDDVGIVGLASDGTTFEVDASQVALDASRTRATFRIRQLAHYQPRRRVACSSNAACATGLQCVNGRCRASNPTNDGGAATCPMSCPSGSSCDPTRQVCVVQPTGCTNTMNCPTNFACVNGACQAPSTTTCGMNAACASGQVCVNGTCAAPPSDGGTINPNVCTSDRDCTMTEVCVNGACRPRFICTATVEICNMVDDDCDGLVDEGCSNTSDGGIMCGGFAGLACPNSLLCVDDPRDLCDPNNGGADCTGLCVAPTDGGTNSCGMNAACATGQTCVNGACVAPPTDAGPNSCGMNAACATGQTCVNGACVASPSDGGGAPFCRTTMDCRVGQCINGLCQ